MATKKNLLLSVSVILGYFLCSVECEHFELNDGQQACVLLDLDAAFELSMGSETAAPFTVDGANVAASKSLCGSHTNSAILTLTLFPSDELLKINFRRDISLQTVSMAVILILDPRKHFENATDLPFELEDSDDLPIGLINMSYSCMSGEQLLFNQDPGYSMTMRITNLQAQAYNIMDGQYSQAIECEQDKMTTVPTTTPSPETTTIEEPTTETTTVSTGSETSQMTGPTTQETPAMLTTETTSPKNPPTNTPKILPTTEPKIVPKYEIKDGDTVCIVFQGQIKFKINYERNDYQTATQNILVPEDAKPDGRCAVNWDNTTQEFKLTFFDNKWSFSVDISEDGQTLLGKSLLRALEETPSYSWKAVMLTYVIDERFDDPKESDIGQEKTVTKEEGEGAFKTSGQGSYKCSDETLELDENVSMDIGEFQYRAFGQDGSANFTNGDVTECSLEENGHNPPNILMNIAIASGAVVILLAASAILYCKVKRKNTSLRQASTISRTEFDTTALCESNDKTIPAPSHANTSHRQVEGNQVSGRRVFVNGKISSSVKISRQGTSPTASSNLDQRNDESEPLLKLL